MLFGMPGIPCIYYGSEWGIKGHKNEGDPALRPAVEKPEWNELTDTVAAMAHAFCQSKPLQYGDFSSMILENQHCIFVRNFEGERVLCAVNASDGEHTFHGDFQAGKAIDLITGQSVDFGGGLTLPGNSIMFLQPM
jgi:glycosidase